MSKNLCLDLFCFVLFYFLKICRFRKDMILLTFFVGIAKENTCAKFQRKSINLEPLEIELEPFEILIF